MRTPNHTIQPMRASRLGQAKSRHPRRLARTADKTRPYGCIESGPANEHVEMQRTPRFRSVCGHPGGAGPPLRAVGRACGAGLPCVSCRGGWLAKNASGVTCL